jgi:hypothetical protein
VPAREGAATSAAGLAAVLIRPQANPRVGEPAEVGFAVA